MNKRSEFFTKLGVPSHLSNALGLVAVDCIHYIKIGKFDSFTFGKVSAMTTLTIANYPQAYRYLEYLSKRLLAQPF